MLFFEATTSVEKEKEVITEKCVKCGLHCFYDVLTGVRTCPECRTPLYGDFIYRLWHRRVLYHLRGELF